jgi:hypothetical protein
MSHIHSIDIPLRPKEGLSALEPVLQTPRDVCLARGRARDGDDLRGNWERWIAEEDRYIEREAPDRYADLIVAGAPTIECDPDREVVVLREEATLGL